MNNTEQAEVWIGVREPFNKNSVWINDGEIKVFDKGWTTISSNKDNGLSQLSLEQTKELIKELSDVLNSKMQKQYSQYAQNNLKLKAREKMLEVRVKELESKLDKLIKRIATSIKIK